MRLLLPTKPFLWTSLNHFISKVVHDKVLFVLEVVANGPRLRIGCLPNLLSRMRRNGHNCTSALNIECTMKFSVHGFVQNLNFLAIYNSMVRSHLDYCSSVWGSGHHTKKAICRLSKSCGKKLLKYYQHWKICLTVKD